MTKRHNLVLQTLLGEKTERIPVAPFIHLNYVDEYFAGNRTDLVVQTIQIYDDYGFDIILRNCSTSFLDEQLCDHPDWRVTTSQQIFKPEDSWQVLTEIRTPERTLQQTRKYNRVSEYEVVEAVIEYYIKEETDFRQFVRYQPPVPPLDLSGVRQACALLEGRGLVAPWAQGAFNMASMYRKLDDLLVDPYLNKPLYDEMMDYFSNRVCAVIQQYADNGADMICCGGNVANGGVVGPDYFASHIMPYEAKLARRVQQMGVFHLYHNCGDARKLLPLYSKIGMNLYESLTPKPYGDTDLETALALFDPRITLSGNIDQIDLLRKGTAAEIEQAVKTTLQAARKRGNFILATTDYFNENTPSDSIAAFAEAARKYGAY